MVERNLYVVEFGEESTPQISDRYLILSGPPIKPAYVVAKDYNDAVTKASFYLEAMIEEAKAGGMFTPDGSLNTKTFDPKIVAIRHISEVIW